MATYTANALQTLTPNSGVVFTETPVQCPYGLVLHQDGTSTFKMRGVSNSPCKRWIRYKVHFQGNVALNTASTIDPITLGVVVDGEVVPTSIATVTPVATGDYFHIHTDAEVLIPIPCCSDVSVRNIGTTTIDLTNVSLSISKE